MSLFPHVIFPSEITKYACSAMIDQLAERETWGPDLSTLSFKFDSVQSNPERALMYETKIVTTRFTLLFSSRSIGFLVVTIVWGILREFLSHPIRVPPKIQVWTWPDSRNGIWIVRGTSQWWIYVGDKCKEKPWVKSRRQCTKTC